MNQRFLLALVLTAIVIVATPLFLSRQPASIKPADSTAVVPARRDSAQAVTVPAAPVVTAAPAGAQLIAPMPTVPADTSVIRSQKAEYRFSNVGAAPVAVTLDSYPSRRPGRKGTKSELVSAGDKLVHLSFVNGRDTVAMDSLTFVRDVAAPTGTIQYSGVAAGQPVKISYRLPAQVADEYLIRLSVDAPTAPAGSALLIRLADKLYSNEPDTLDDLGHLAVSYRPARGAVQSVGYSKLDTSEARLENGPVNWVAIRNKYFLLVARGVSSPFSSLSVLAKPKTGKIAAASKTVMALPFKNGVASADVYAGPQDFERLQHLGGDLDQVNPYAGWFHGVVQPVATVVMKALLWMKRTTHLNYGWVLVLFGVAIRLLLWPLNQSAMRTSMNMQRLQPELQALQKRYSDDPRKQQEAIMKLYKEHNMSPLSPLMGCLPMLLPMPVLFALYFVFQNTIEFRGVPFLWLPDISLRDPYYITPLFMGASMYLMSWIGMRNAPPNPQAKMMSYMMPVMFTALFLNFASGLNLYYAIQNVAAIPQQWLLARERGKNPPPVASSAIRKRAS